MTTRHHPDRRVADRFADFVHGLSDRVLPESVHEAITNRIIDTVAVGIAGSETSVVQRIISATATTSTSDDGATVWGTNLRLAPAAAALVNAAAAHAEDYDDTHAAGVVHGSACVVPAALAAAETRGLSMKDVHRGVLAGWEVAARLGIASSGAFHRRGLHTTSVAGVFGAAAAVSAVWRLSKSETAAALGLAGSAAGGLNVYLQDGTPGKLLNPAFAAQAGFQSAALAEADVAGPGYVFEGGHGLYDALGEGVPDLDAALHDLGHRWEIEQVSTKPYSACHFAHSTIDAAIDIKKHGVDLAEITRIQCDLPEPTWDLLCRPWEAKLAPSSVYSVRFSLPWLVSLALTDGEITRDTFGPHLLERNDIRALAAKVEARRWDDSPYPESFPGRVTVTTHGSSVTKSRLINRGHPDAPLSSRELRDKFTSCVHSTLCPDSANHLLETLRDSSASVHSLFDSRQVADSSPSVS